MNILLTITKLTPLLILSYLLTALQVQADEAVSDWAFHTVLGWAWRDIDGTLFSHEPPLTGAATTDSLGLGSSSEPTAVIGARWKRFSAEFVYLPSKFSGEGYLHQSIDLGPGPIIDTNTPIKSDLEVTMMLADIQYAIIKRSNMEIGVGAGAGQVDLDIAMIPAVGPEVNVSGTVPFGYLTVTFLKRWDKLVFNLGAQGLSVSKGENSVSYNSANAVLGYRVYQRGSLGFDVIAGYRYVNFEYTFDDNHSDARSSTDFELKGPNVALRMLW